MQSRPETILNYALQRATNNLNTALIADENVVDLVGIVSRNTKNRAGVRLILACSLAKVHQPHVDIRKPYTEIGTKDAFSGRTYDEKYISTFIIENDLPCNTTTAFLTPALRNHNSVLDTNINLVGRPPIVYQAVLQLFDAVYKDQITSESLLAETIRQLILFRNQNRNRMEQLLSNLRDSGELILSSEQILTLMQQHLSSKGASRLPVLLVAAAYKTIGHLLHETISPLEAHTAADSQTKSLGDVQVIHVADKSIMTAYEMKTRRVTQQDIDIAIQKITQIDTSIDNYIFITTEEIEHDVQEYAQSFYDKIGIEFVILDCLHFLKYFLHLFHRYRLKYLNHYQELLLAESNSAVSQALKEVFLALRQAAESDT